MKTHPAQAAARASLLAAGTIAVLLLTAGPGLAAGHARKTARGDLLLSSEDGRSFVQPPGGERLRLPLAKDARISDFRSTDQDWLVAAVSHARRAAGGQMVSEPRIELLTGRGTEVETLPSPALERAAELRQPTFVADRRAVHALIWLAGDAHNQLAVRVSRWLGSGWGASETISPPGKGTQIALSTAVLDDGTWLTVWAAFDGRDDEIMWSRFAGGVWSKPRPIAEDNAVPDVTPSLFATAGGALIAWSRYDGNDYRVNVARFDGERFSTPTVAGPAGSTAPTFSDLQRPYLIYRHADPPAWAVIELDAGGAVLREAVTSRAEQRRPVLAAATDQTVKLEWLSLERQPVSAPLSWRER